MFLFILIKVMITKFYFEPKHSPLPMKTIRTEPNDILHSFLWRVVLPTPAFSGCTCDKKKSQNSFKLSLHPCLQHCVAASRHLDALRFMSAYEHAYNDNANMLMLAMFTNLVKCVSMLIFTHLHWWKNYSWGWWECLQFCRYFRTGQIRIFKLF